MAFLFFWLAGCASITPSPAERVAPEATDTLRVDPAPLARFQRAAALRADPLGRLYVADAGADVVVRYDLGREIGETLGGPGVRDGAFSAPLDLDPTNGLTLVVADAGNGRIQRFSNEFLHLGTWPVPRVEALDDPGGRDPGELPNPFAPAGGDRGRPVAVAVTEVDETFVAEAERGVVLKWDAQGRVQRVLGGLGAGAGRLSEPVGLAVDENVVYVADAGLDAVLVYDHAGVYARSLGRGGLPGLRGVQVLTEGELVAVLPDRLVVYAPTGRRLGVLAADLPGPLVDALRVEGVWYLLTPRALYRAARPQ